MIICKVQLRITRLHDDILTIKKGSSLKVNKTNGLKRILILIMLIGVLINANAITITITSNTNWSTITGGSGSNGVPSSSDAIIVNGATLIMDMTDAVCASIILGSTANGTLSFGANGILTISGSMTLGSISYTGSLDMSIGGTLKISGSLTAPKLGSWNAGTGTIEYNGASQTIYKNSYYNLTLSGSNIKTFQKGTTINKDFTLSGTVSTIFVEKILIGGDLYIGSGTTLDLSTYTANRETTGGTMTVNGTLLLGGNNGGQTGSNFPTNFTNLNLTGGTINYNYAGSQTVYGVIYNSLILSGGTKTLQSATTSITGNLTLSDHATITTVAGLIIEGNLSIGNTCSFTAAGFNLTINGTTTVGGGTSGGLTFNSTTGIKIFKGLVTINNNGGWNNITINSPIEFQGGITSSSASFNVGSGNQLFTTNPQTITGTFTIAYMTIRGVTLTNTGTLNTGTTLTGSGGIVQAANAKLNITGLSDSIFLVATNSGNTVSFSGPNQYIIPAHYNNLTLSGSATKAMIGAIVVNGNLTVNTGITLDTSNKSLSGNLKNSGTLTFGNSSVFIVGSVDQSIAGFNTAGLVTFTKTSGTATLTSILKAGSITMNSGGLVNLGSFTHTAGSLTLGTIGQIPGSYGGTGSPVGTIINPTYFDAASGKLIVSCIPGLWTGVTSTNWNTGSNWCDGVVPTSVTNVVINSGTTNQPVINATDAFCNDITINSGTTLSITGANKLTISGNAINNGSFTASGTSTVNYNSPSGNQSVMGGTYYNLTLSNISGAEAAGGTLTVNGMLTTTSGGTLDMGSSHIINGPMAKILNNGTIITSVPTLVSSAPLPPNKSWGGVVKYNATNGVQTVMSGTYSILTLGNMSGTQTASGNITASTLNMTDPSDVLDMSTNILLVTSVNNSGTIKTQSISTLPLSSNITWGGTVDYYAATGGQTVMGGTYNNLTLSNSGGVQNAGSDITANGTLTTTSGGTLDMHTFQLSGSPGAINNQGTIATQNTSTTPIPSGKTWNGEIVYNGTSPQTAATGTYSDLTINNATGVYLTDTTTTTTVAGKLWIKSGARIEIGTNTELKADSIKNDTGTSGILIKAGNNVPNGTLTFTGTAPLASVEMYSKASWDLADTIVNNRYKWQYFGIPVQTVAANPTFNGSYVRQWLEAGTSSSSHWLQLSDNSVLNSFQGYELCQEFPKTLVFKGQLENRDFTLPLSVTDGATYAGQHIFANSYTAAIDIGQLDFGDHTEHTVYLYNTGSYYQWSANKGDSIIGSSPGQYLAIPQIPSGENGLPRQIPSMQAMLVKALDNSDKATFGMRYQAVTTKNTEKQRVKALNQPKSSDKVCTVIDVRGTHYSDRMWIFTDPTCSHQFNNGWDGAKLLGSALSPQLYAIESDGNYQVDAVDDMNNTNIGFLSGQDVNYTFTFTNSNLESKYAGLYLRDNVENKTVDITESGSTYSFQTGSTFRSVNRFSIITRPFEQDGPDNNSELKMFSSKSTILLQNLSSLTGDLVIYDIAGHYLKKLSFPRGGITAVTGMIPGAYIARAVTGKEGITKRLIVQ